MEDFRTIPGFPDYEVSNLGNVRSYKRKRPKLLKSRKWERNYRVVSLRRDNEYHTRLVHILVMLTFVGPKPEGQCVRHLDGDPSNNALTNLAYGTLSENQRDRIEHKTYGMKLNVRKVKIIRGLSKCGFKRTRLAEMFGVSRTAIHRILRQQTWANID